MEILWPRKRCFLLSYEISTDFTVGKLFLLQGFFLVSTELRPHLLSVGLVDGFPGGNEFFSLWKTAPRLVTTETHGKVLPYVRFLMQLPSFFNLDQGLSGPTVPSARKSLIRENLAFYGFIQMCHGLFFWWVPWIFCPRNV